MKKILNELLIFICIVAVIASGFYIGKYYVGVKTEENVYRHIELPPEPDDDTGRQADKATKWIARLQKKNPDVAGWLRVPGTRIDYPVMQAEKNNPEYYLHRNIQRKYSASGALFAAANCDIGKPSDNVVIFGHHMKAGTMFGTLPRFENKDFYKKHHTMKLYTVRGWETYKVIAVYKTSISGDRHGLFRYHSTADFDTPEELAVYMSEIEKRQIYDTDTTVTFGDKLLSISTCEYSQRDGRLVIIAKRLS